MSKFSLEKISERDKVIVGKDGWLFLGSGSNDSVAQFVGDINLDAAALEKFRTYLRALKSKVSCDFFFSISPNKE